MSEIIAERWFQALRLWRTRTVSVPRVGNPRSSATYPLRSQSYKCRVCQSGRVDKYDELISYTIMTGKDLRKALRMIAEELGAPIHRVEWHLHNCLMPMREEVSVRLIGEWVNGGTEYVETPAGWLRSSRVMQAIREHPDRDTLLAIVRLETRRKTLLNRGYYRDKSARRIGSAILGLVESLG